jgi:putative transposase
MPRRLEKFVKGQYYHLYNRGNNRQNIFFERENYLYFLRLIRHYFLPQNLVIIAYCLMPNHYHLLGQCNSDNLSDLMKSLSLAYSKAINQRFNRIGSLFQGRFKGRLVDKEEYLIHLVRYIHLNPVKANLVKNPQEWEFSSYSEYAGLRQGKIPQIDLIRQQITSQRAYQSFLDGDHISSLAEIKVLMLDE